MQISIYIELRVVVMIVLVSRTDFVNRPRSWKQQGNVMAGGLDGALLEGYMAARFDSKKT